MDQEDRIIFIPFHPILQRKELCFSGRGKDKKCSGNDHAPYGFSSAAFFA